MSNVLKEKEDFQQLIIERLVEENKYRKRNPKTDFNTGYAMDTELLFEFITSTQPNEYEKLCKIYKQNVNNIILNRINDEINKSTRGLIDVLKNGVQIDNSVTLKLLYNKPATSFNPKLLKKYNLNILSVMEEVYHKPGERIDLVIFLNGLAIMTFELKCNTSGQSVADAIEQYKTDRDPSTRLLKYKIGALVNFAMDLEQVYMCTCLNRKSSVFLPFNPSEDEVKKDKDKLKVSYMWEDILTKETLIYLIQRFIFVEKSKKENKITGKIQTKETQIFPRYHQLHAVRKITADIKEFHTDKNYLIQHSAGSGKTNSIAWLSHILSDLHDNNDINIFDTIIVMTDRIIVDRQLQDAISSLSHKSGLLKVLGDGCKAEDLKNAINGNTKIIVTTIQKFRYIYENVENSANKTFAIIIDEAHASTSGQNMIAVSKALSQEDEENELSMGEMIETEIAKNKKPKNVSIIAFTATPTKNTLDAFGTLNEKGKKECFDLYSMKQAIEEGFILNVLDNYTTYETYYKINKLVDEDDFVKTKNAKRQINKLVESNDMNISQKVAIIVEHFKNNIMHMLGGEAKAMVVTSSRANAVKYKKEFEKYIKENGYQNIHALVAFSGKVILKDDPAEYTSIMMNTEGHGLPKGFREEDDYIRQSFDTEDYNVLLVANKFQTGFDQKKLVAMYVDKKLKNVAAVQTLSRLNRICPPYDKKTFVLDFKNTYESIKKSFSTWYDTTQLIESINPHDIYDVEAKLDAWGLLDYDDINEFNDLIYLNKRTSKQKEKMWGILQVAKDKFDKFKIIDQYEIKITIKKFIKFYSFMIQVSNFSDIDLHKKYNFLSYLIKELDINSGTVELDITHKISATDFVQKETGTFTDGGIEQGEGLKASRPTDFIIDEDKKQKLSEIIKEINDYYNKEFNVDVATKSVLQIKDLLLENVKLKESAKVNKLKDFKFTYNDCIKDALLEGYEQNIDFFELLLNNSELKDRLMNVYVEEIYKTLRINSINVAEEIVEYSPFKVHEGKFKTRSGRNIYYYGEEYGDYILNKGRYAEKIKTLNDLFDVLLKTWKKETAFPQAQKDVNYNINNDPTYGQCAVTAAIVFDLFGGTIHKINVYGGGTHYFNKIDGHYIDLTKDQFDLYKIPLDYEPNRLIERKSCCASLETKKRLDLLIEEIEKNI